MTNLERATIALFLCLPLTAGAQPFARVQVPGVQQPVLLDSIAIAHKVDGSVERVLKAIDEVYAEFDLPVETFDPQAGRFPNRRVTKSRRLGKSAMSRFLDCGRGFNGNNADIYRVTIATAAWPEPATGTATKIHIALIGGGLDPSGAGDGYVVCTSRGFFEEDFAKRVNAKLASSP
jgi:hypothetical protein